MSSLRFSLFDLPPAVEPLRRELRAFLAEVSPHWSPETRGHNWTCFDKAFSQELGRRGWIGMTWPKQYGGHERTAFERYVVLEELLAAGAPCGAHWIADRQSGPLLLRAGNDEQRKLLPGLARGDISICIGMSDPDAGSSAERRVGKEWVSTWSFAGVPDHY